MKISILTAALVTLLTGCALPQAQAEQPEQVKEQETRIVIMQDGEKKEWRFSGENWRDSAEWQQFSAELAPEQRQKLEKLLTEAPPAPPAPPHPPKVNWHEFENVKHIVVRRGDGEPDEHRIIEIHAQAKEHKFEAIKRLLESADLSQEQLQQLQALLDSKH
ncbi:hypothetical protein [Arsukibacterium sp.]|uniref:hypothetical protein n=1 Tax=Arsukibacterium sp. TaxID=1977258 RepID=UPI00299F37DF|nr:hypothetical protein [Arsukibacterium sp.]MDX1678576.1 hypothetical protein [Arsukibacterium sp.]